jgi:triacylglycerol lipase
MAENWAYLSPILAARGYCVFALTYGVNPVAPFPFDQFGGVVPIEQSAHQLSGFVDRVVAATDAAKVDIVGHSEGSLMPDYYVKFLGGSAHVARYVGLTPLWDGTNLGGLATLYRAGASPGFSGGLGAALAPYCGSCTEFLTGSEFLARLNAGGAAAPGVVYTTVMTRLDELVVPYTSGYLSGAGVTNIVLQDRCPSDVAEHAALAVDPVTAQLVLNALDPGHARPLVCGALFSAPPP